MKPLTSCKLLGVTSRACQVNKDTFVFVLISIEMVSADMEKVILSVLIDGLSEDVIPLLLLTLSPAFSVASWFHQGQYIHRPGNRSGATYCTKSLTRTFSIL